MGCAGAGCPVGMLREEDWLEIYRDTIRPLYGWVSRRAGGDAALAEDVSQETWLRALRAWRRSGPPSKPLAWLCTAAGNLLRNHFKRHRPVALTAGGVDLEEESFEPASPDAAALLQWGLARLRGGQARLLEAHHLDGVAIADLAAELGLSERAVEGRLHRSRHALKRHLEPFYQA